MKHIIATYLAAALVAAPAVHAAGIDSGAGFVIGEKFGLLAPDSSRNLDDDMFVEYYAGYRFGPAWEATVGLVTGGFDPDQGLRSAKIDSGYSATVLYHFSNSLWQPYVAAGVTDFTYDYSGLAPDEFDGDINFAAAVGIKRFLSPAMFVSGEFKQVLDSDEGDSMLSVGLGYLFGQSAGAAKPLPAPAPAAVTARDSDSDGVVDSADSCPNTAYGATVNAKGCELDSDSDGVVDSKDECANTGFGASVDGGGCEVEMVTQTASIQILVQFASNSSILQGDATSEIKKAADFMKTYGDSTLVVEGHTDSMGTAEYNKFLSQKRADKVREVLIAEFGVDPKRVTAVGFGEERPIADNSTAAGRQQNRRVVGVVEGQRTVRKQ